MALGAGAHAQQKHGTREALPKGMGLLMSSSFQAQKRRYRLEFTQLSPSAPLVEEVAGLREEANVCGKDFIICTSNPELARQLYDELSPHCASSRIRLDCRCLSDRTEVAPCTCAGGNQGSASDVALAITFDPEACIQRAQGQCGDEEE